MSVFSRSWEITKLSFNVMLLDKELFIFPILSVIISLVFLAVLGFTVLLGAITATVSGVRSLGGFEYVILFLMYVGLNFISSFFSVCVVYTAGVRFNGKNATFSESIKFGFKRIFSIFLWSIVNSTVGLLLNILENLARRIKGLGKILLSITESILGTTWDILTIFVIQGIAYDNLGPFKAIKQSTLILKKTWGESLIKYLGLGTIEILFILPGIIISGPIILFGIRTSGWFVFFYLAIIIAYILAVILVFNIASQIYNTALYVYAKTGKIPKGFNEDIMVNAFKK